MYSSLGLEAPLRWPHQCLTKDLDPCALLVAALAWRPLVDGCAGSSAAFSLLCPFAVCGASGDMQ